MTEVWRGGVPEFGGRAAKSPGRHGNQSRGGDGERDEEDLSEGMGTAGWTSADEYGGARLWMAL